MYDGDGDGFIDAEELEASPPLSAAQNTIDTNHDGRLSEDEILVRLEEWLNSEIALFTRACRVSLDGKPLADATVRFEPEAFLGDDFQVVEGPTSTWGNVKFNTLPGMPIPGLPPGLYRVRITKIVDGEQIIPAKYNEQTTLGQEIANGAKGMERALEFQLKSN